LVDLLTGLVIPFAGPLLVIWWLPYLVHELGHLLGANLAGAGFDSVQRREQELAGWRRSVPRRSLS
jgi:hypothetical protein